MPDIQRHEVNSDSRFVHQVASNLTFRVFEISV